MENLKEEKQNLGPREYHPYEVHIPQTVGSIIIGSFPIGKFTNPERSDEIKDNEIDFYYGGESNQLWELLGECFQLNLSTKDEIINFLEGQGMAIGDVLYSCRRKDGGGSDSALKDIEFNKSLGDVIRKHRIKKIYFTSEQVHDWFLKGIDSTTEGREVVVLISPSKQGVRRFREELEDDYKKQQAGNPEINKTQYRLNFYKKIFRS